MQLQLAPQLDQLQEFESQLTDTKKERDSVKKEIRKLDKEVKKKQLAWITNEYGCAGWASGWKM